MKKEAEQKLKEVHRCVEDELLLSNGFKAFETYLEHVISSVYIISAKAPPDSDRSRKCPYGSSHPPTAPQAFLIL